MILRDQLHAVPCGCMLPRESDQIVQVSRSVFFSHGLIAARDDFLGRLSDHLAYAADGMTRSLYGFLKLVSIHGAAPRRRPRR